MTLQFEYVASRQRVFFGNGNVTGSSNAVAPEADTRTAAALGSNDALASLASLYKTRAAVESTQRRRCGPGTAAELRLEGKHLMIFLAHHLRLLIHATHKQDMALWEAELAAPTLTLTSSAWAGWHEVDHVD